MDKQLNVIVIKIANIQDRKNALQMEKLLNVMKYLKMQAIIANVRKQILLTMFRNASKV